MNNAKASVYQILDRPEEGDTASKVVDGLLMALIALNVIVAILRTVQSFDDRFGHHLYYFDRASIAVFSIEYLLRVWSCTVDDKYQQPLSGRIRYMFSPPALIDLFAIAPYYLALDLRYLRVFRLFFLFKLGRYASRLRLIRNVLVAKKEELVISTSLALVALIFCSAAMYYVEKDQQPEAFSSIPSSMWWAIETLSTVGYGDVIPVTATGKLLGGMVALIGIALFACALAIPMAFTEEVWALGSTLSSGRIVLVAVTSLLTLAFFVHSLFYPGKFLREYRLDFLKRLVTSYLLALTVAMVLLILIDKGPLDDLQLALRRAVLIAFPASFAATAVDYIK